MKWLVIPWLISLVWFAFAYAALGEFWLAMAGTSVPIFAALIVTSRVLYTYRRWIEDRATAARLAEAMAWNLPEPGHSPANQNQPPR